mgnify:CR=1 FL=1
MPLGTLKRYVASQGEVPTRYIVSWGEALRHDISCFNYALRVKCIAASTMRHVMLSVIKYHWFEQWEELALFVGTRPTVLDNEWWWSVLVELGR